MCIAGLLYAGQIALILDIVIQELAQTEIADLRGTFCVGGAKICQLVCVLFQRAKEKGLSTEYIDAQQDIEAAILA